MATNAIPIRFMSEDAPRAEYRKRGSKKSKGMHWGQRKLLMNEIEFLTMYGRPGRTVVYAGSAPGTHTEYMSRVLFPEMKMVLVDPRAFDAKTNERITVRQEFFTDDLAREFAGQDVLFISDIRTEPNDDEHCAADMAAQMRWHCIMHPAASMFKFRLPWTAGQTEYLAGAVSMQPYGHPQTTETRLIVSAEDGMQMRMWDNKKYEQQCFFFNTVTRLAPHPHRIKGAGLNSSWDCAAEVHILREYLASRGGRWAELSVREQDARISKLSWALSVDAHACKPRAGCVARGPAARALARARGRA